MAAARHDLIARAQGGDAVALERRLRECRSDVRRYAIRHCMTSEVDDAVQETLLVVARRLRSLRAAVSFSGWLFTIVRRECRRLTRKGGQFVELRPGSAPPSTRIERIDGKFVALDAFRGKVVLVNFWATWCPPCRRELTQLDKLQQSIGTSPLVIVAVSIDDGGRSTVEAFLKRLDIDHLLPISTRKAGSRDASERIRLPHSSSTRRRSPTSSIVGG